MSLQMWTVSVWFAFARVTACSAQSLFSYNETESKMFASLSSVAYCDDFESIQGWTCDACKDSMTRLVPGKIKIIDSGSKNATRFIIGRLADQDGCLMIFRGSDNVENWVRDFQVWEIDPKAFEGCDGCMVHRGFYEIWENVRDAAVGALREVGCAPGGKDSLLYITGHSLGAALTHLAMFTLDDAGYNVAQTYSFEAPRVGNKKFSDEFSSRFLSKFPVFRVTHYKDPVPHLPPEALGYRHVQTEVFYNKTNHYQICRNVEDKLCADQFWNLPDLVIFHNGDHCASPLVPNGDLCNPTGCSRPLYTVV